MTTQALLGAFGAAQAQALLDGGVDCFVLESFEDLNEIHKNKKK